MKPRVPIEVWAPPPDPVDGLLGGAPLAPVAPPPALQPQAAKSEPAAPARRREPSAELERVRPARRVSAPAMSPKIHLTIYLAAEEIELLRVEQLRRQREQGRSVRGVTDASAVVGELIRKHLK